MYQVECMIDEVWKPQINSNLLVYYVLQSEAETERRQLQMLSDLRKDGKQFRVVSHTF